MEVRHSLRAPLPAFQRPVMESGTVLTTPFSEAVMLTACVTWLRKVLIGKVALLTPTVYHDAQAWCCVPTVKLTGDA